MNNGQPLCGWAWYHMHKNDYTQAQIDSLSIAISHHGQNLPPVRQDKRDRGLVKDLVKSYRKEVRG